MKRATLAPLLLAALAWMPAPRAPAVAPARGPATGSAADPGCAGVSYQGRCLPPPRCGRDALDLDGLCVPTAAMGEAADDALPAARETNAHVDRAGRRVVYEHLPRRPELPADYNRYRYPVPPWGAQAVSSGYDLDRPDELQRRGESMNAVGHGGVDLPQERGTPVRAVALRGEAGEPEVVFVGELFGHTVVLRHVVREGGAAQTFLAIHAHLESAAPGLRPGMAAPPGTTLGFVGDSGALGVVHLHYEVRWVRAGVDPLRVEPPQRLVQQDVSIPCDPRNVLPFQ
jgi:murein DD-endopeptidase MepM/ murein hydrolase activator NlpD